MHLKHFFRGFLKREEVASAFLATLLENDPEFRLSFFQYLFPDAAVGLANAGWNVQVEVDRVDVRLDSDTAVVLIENKVRAGAYESGQLLRYYETELGRVTGDKRIFVAFVAPEGVGTHETDNLTMMESFRENDSAAWISWQTLSNIPTSLNQIESRRWFIESGFKEIERIIDKDTQPLYPREGTRAVIAGISDDALHVLQSLSQVQLSRWSGRDCEQILTNKTNVTMWLDLAFDTEDEPPHRPINVMVGERLKVILKTQFKLAKVGRRVYRLKDWWSQRVAEGVFEIPKLGEHHLDQKGWFVRSEETELSPEDLSKAVTKAGLSVLEELSKRLAENGLSLCISEQEPSA